MKIFYLVGLIFLLVFLLAVGTGFLYFFVIPPQIVSVSPLNQSSDISLNSPLIIKFDKPVGRQKINHSTIPEVYGEWKFEDPLIQNHLFKTLVFIPEVELKPDTKYYIKLDSIAAPLNVGFNNRLSFSFKTKPADIKPANGGNPAASGIKNSSEVISKLIKTPFHWQDHPLSCEAAALKMALGAKGINVSEDDIMQKIGYDTTAHAGNTWGDPNVAFVGNINGSMCTTGYGVHWKPVANAASYWRPAEYFSGWGIKQLIDEIKLGNPVILWGVLPTGRLTDCSWYTPKGEYIKTFKQGHVRVAVGFIGSSDSPAKIIIKDSLSGDLYWSVPELLTNWNVYDNSGVVVR